MFKQLNITLRQFCLTFKDFNLNPNSSFLKVDLENNPKTRTTKLFIYIIF